MSTEQQLDQVLVAGAFTVTDVRGARLFATRLPGGGYRLFARDGYTLDEVDRAALAEFLGARAPITEEEVTARIAQTAYYDKVIEKAREIHDVLERAVQERVDEPAAEGSALFDARLLLGLDGGTGARDIREDDGPACRVCGCTENRACAGGCWWVPDPTMQGRLCSACSAAGRG